MNSSRGVFRPSKLDDLGSQFTLKSMFTPKQLVSKKFNHGKLVTLILFFFKLWHFTEE